MLLISRSCIWFILLSETAKEATEEWEKLDRKCIVVQAILLDCVNSSGKEDGKEISITFKGFSRGRPNKKEQDVTKCLKPSDAEQQIAEKYRKIAEIDCYMSPGRDIVSVRSEPRGSPPVLGFTLGSLIMIGLVLAAFSMILVCRQHQQQRRVAVVNSSNMVRPLARSGPDRNAPVLRSLSPRQSANAPLPLGDSVEYQQRSSFVQLDPIREAVLERTLVSVAQCRASLQETSGKQYVCAICLEELSPTTEIGTTSRILPYVVRLPCSHWYHGAACLETWIRRGSTLCPVCKFDLAVCAYDESIT